MFWQQYQRDKLATASLDAGFIVEKSSLCFYEKVIKVKADVAALLILFCFFSQNVIFDLSSASSVTDPALFGSRATKSLFTMRFWRLLQSQHALGSVEAEAGRYCVAFISV